MTSGSYPDQRGVPMQHRPAPQDYQSYGSAHVQPQAFVHGGQAYPQTVHAPAPIIREPLRGRDSQGRQYALEVKQQPERARMCGYGDKDRRPITPPVAVRLVITDSAGRDVDISSVNPQHYVLNVDLFDEQGYTAANLIQQLDRGASSSISAAKPGPYPPQQPQWYGGDMSMMGGYMHAPPHQGGGMGGYGGGWQPRDVHNVQQYTRNLIGNVAVSASVLSDTSSTVGIWFVLQDLSVRQEGSYRLKFMFTDLGPSLTSGAAKPAPILSAIYSEVFQVHSAKKFPGVKESTALSKCFAQQGVKIPIRKEGGKRNGDDDDEDE